MAALRASGAKRVLDLGCGEGKLLRELLKDKQFEEIVGMDVSIRTLETAQRRLKLDRLPTMQANRIKLIHGSLMYRDKRLEGFDAAAVVEVVEHLDPPRLSAFERVLFEFARPRTVVLTTPNREYNVTWETLPAGTISAPRPPLRVDPAGVSGLGDGHCWAVWLCGAVPAGGTRTSAGSPRRRWESSTCLIEFHYHPNLIYTVGTKVRDADRRIAPERKFPASPWIGRRHRPFSC